MSKAAIDYRENESDKILEKARAECDFNDRVYEILLAYQRGGVVRGRVSESVPPGRVGELNVALSRIFNQIWSAAQDLSAAGKARAKKKEEVIA